MKIREYMKDDKEKVINLYNKCFSHKCNEINMIPTGTILVLEEDNKIIGMGTIDILNDIFKDVKYGYLNNICVDPDYQGRGLGNYLVKEIEKYARENNCNYLMLTSSKKRVAAHKVYLKNEFEIVDTCVFKKYFN